MYVATPILSRRPSVRPSVRPIWWGGLFLTLDTIALLQLVIWTASGKTYADAIIDLLDADGEFFSQRLYRESCVRLKDARFKDVYIKDLRRLGLPMDTVVLVDNYVYSFGLTLDNGIPIFPWTGDEVMINIPFFVIHCYKFVVLRLVLMQIFEVQCNFWTINYYLSMLDSKILLMND